MPKTDFNVIQLLSVLNMFYAIQIFICLRATACGPRFDDRSTQIRIKIQNVYKPAIPYQIVYGFWVCALVQVCIGFLAYLVNIHIAHSEYDLENCM